MGEADTAARYRRFGAAEVRSHSPAYERLSFAVADDPELVRRLDELTFAKRQPNLLFAAVRYLGGPVDDPAEFRSWTLQAWPRVVETMLTRSTQTNEAGRCATLLPLLARLPQPLALLEVGASAGLCLYPDRYAYRYLAGSRIVERGNSAVELECRVADNVPLPEALPQVVWRAGLDLNPLDVARDDDLGWLESLIWPEQESRRDRLREAAHIVRREPPLLARGDLLTDLEPLAARAPGDATLVVFHSAVLAYVGEADRARFVSTVDALSGHWISNEAPGVLPGTDVPAEGFVVSLDGHPVAAAGPHGQSLAWLSD